MTAGDAVPRPLRVAVLVPARNEAESLPRLLEALRAVDPGPGLILGPVVVVDNGSTDETAAVATAAGALVVAESGTGYGRACLRGIRVLRSRTPPPDVLVFLDADDWLAPLQIPRLVAPLQTERADLVIGERRSARGEGVRWHARIGNAWISVVLRGLYGSTTRDMGPFRAIRWRCLMDLRLDDPNYGWYVQMQVRALRRAYAVTGVPVAFHRRRLGTSKISGSWRASIVAGWVMLRTLVAEAVRDLDRL